MSRQTSSLRVLFGAVLVSAVSLAAACGGDDASAAGGDDVGAANLAAGQNTDTPAMDDMGAETAGEQTAMPQEFPAGVTAAMVSDGKAVYEGAGICSSCHGATGAGVPNLGANLRDAEWKHSDGSYPGIVKTIKEGVTAEKSTSGVPMPPKAGTNITDAQVNAVAAYVWTLGKG